MVELKKLENFKGQQLHFSSFSDPSFYIIFNQKKFYTRINNKKRKYKKPIAPNFVISLARKNFSRHKSFEKYRLL